MYKPLDTTAYPQDPTSCVADSNLADGWYCFVQDEKGMIWVLPAGHHVHVKVLGGGREAMYAGEMEILTRRVQKMTNSSGTFMPDDPQGLLDAADQLKNQGLVVEPGAVIFMDHFGTARPVTLA